MDGGRIESKARLECKGRRGRKVDENYTNLNLMTIDKDCFPGSRRIYPLLPTSFCRELKDLMLLSNTQASTEVGRTNQIQGIGLDMLT
jgi:hypothetical protein